MTDRRSRPPLLGHPPVRTAVLATLLVGVLLPVNPVAAATGDPVREPGSVVRVVDGDTVDVLVDGSSQPTRVRLARIQAFETGECGAAAATARLRSLAEGQRVELRARHVASKSDGRPIRSVHLPLAAGGSADLNQLLLLEGHGLWFPLGDEITGIADYHVAATHARRAGRGIWEDDRCGAGPQAGHPTDLWVKSDADGDDRTNLNDEYVVIVNRHPSQALALGGWLLRESSQFRQEPDQEGYRFPAEASIPAGERLVVRVGSGRNSPTQFFIGSTSPLFDNADHTTGTDDNPAPGLGLGDGTYLLDPLGNVRKAFPYPCVVDCNTPLAGALVIDHVEYDPPRSRPGRHRVRPAPQRLRPARRAGRLPAAQHHRRARVRTEHLPGSR